MWIRLCVASFCMLVTCLTGLIASGVFANRHEVQFEQIHDFGDTLVSPADLSSKELFHSFEIYNPSNRPLTIKYKGSSCGCTTPILSNNVIEPCRSADVGVSVRIAGHSQHINEHVVLTASHPSASSDQHHNEIKLYIQAKLIKELDANEIPKKEIELTPGERCSFDFRVNTRTNTPESQTKITVRALGSLAPYVITSVIDNTTSRVEAGYLLQTTKYRCVIHVPNISDIISSFDSRETLVLSISSGSNVIQEGVSARIEKKAYCSPSFLFLKPGGPAQNTVMYTDEPTQIVSIEASADGLTCQVINNEDHIKTMAVAINTSREDLKEKRQLYLKIHYKGLTDSELVLPVYILGNN